jgi:hypothetical protein
MRSPRPMLIWHLLSCNFCSRLFHSVEATLHLHGRARKDPALPGVEGP